MFNTIHINYIYPLSLIIYISRRMLFVLPPEMGKPLCGTALQKYKKSRLKKVNRYTLLHMV